MFTTVMNQVINEITRQPAATGGLPAASARATPAGSPGRVNRFHGARRTARSRGLRRRSKPVQQLPEKYRILASTFRVAAGFF